MKQFVLKSVSMILIISLLSAQNFSILANTKMVPVTFDESVFSYDEDLLMAELSDINKLDVYVEANEGITLDELSREGSPLIANMEGTVSPMGMAGDEGNGEPPLGIPSFLWGCVFGIIGLLIVYVATENDKDEAKKAMWGCLASTAVSVLIYAVAFAAVDASY
jgi:hypothetical protein